MEDASRKRLTAREIAHLLVESAAFPPDITDFDLNGAGLRFHEKVFSFCFLFFCGIGGREEREREREKGLRRERKRKEKWNKKKK